MIPLLPHEVINFIQTLLALLRFICYLLNNGRSNGMGTSETLIKELPIFSAIDNSPAERRATLHPQIAKNCLYFEKMVIIELKLFITNF